MSTTRDMIQNKRKRRPMDEEEQKETYDQKQKREMIAVVSEKVAALGDDVEELQRVLNLSDETLGKLQQMFEHVFSDSGKKDNAYYRDLVGIHAKLAPCLIGLVEIVGFVSHQQRAEFSTGNLADTIELMYKEGTFMKKHLVQELYSRRDYHREQVKQIAEVLKQLKTPVKVKNLKIGKTQNSPFDNASSFL